MTLQPIGQCRVPLSISNTFNGQPNSFHRAYQNGELFGTSEARVQKIARQEHVVLHKKRENHNRELTSLRLVNSDSPG